MKIFFPIHLDGGNRGCEAIAKGTAVLLDKPKEELIGLCNDRKLDRRLGIDKYVTLYTRSLWEKVYAKLYRGYLLLTENDFIKRCNRRYGCFYNIFLNKMETDDILFSTGGDMMCYGNNEVIYTNNRIHEYGLKSVLWGCSIGKNNLTPEKIETLKRFSLIYARESLTATMLTEYLRLDNVVTFPDPAFVLEPEKVQLPDCFNGGKVIGLNLSNFVLGGFNFHSALGKDVVTFIDTVINSSDRHILLIPHVMWDDQDDRIVSRIMYDKYKDTGRVHLLDSDSLNYCQLRYVISKCFMFIGARTHAVISAYSTCVPSIALGYSIKSRGIAIDLSMPMDTIVDSKNYKPKAFLQAYDFVDKHADKIREILQKNILAYKNSTYGIREVIRNLYNN